MVTAPCSSMIQSPTPSSHFSMPDWLSWVFHLGEQLPLLTLVMLVARGCAAGMRHWLLYSTRELSLQY